MRIRARSMALLVAVLATHTAAGAQGLPATDDPAIVTEIEKLRQPGMMNVPREDGELLRDLILERGYTRALEIGTSNGYSAAWMALALRKTGGRLITLEIDEHRAALAARNFARLGLDAVIELRRGDALALLPALEGPFDLVFIDAWKRDYVEYLRLVFPKVRRGGAIVAHNVRSHAGELREFLRAIESHPELDTRIDHRSSAGTSISIKR
jgi:caffeoyl-CoA O-methyltransferase